MFKNKILKSKKQKNKKSKTRKRIKGGASVNNAKGTEDSVNNAKGTEASVNNAKGSGSRFIKAAGNAISSVRNVTRRFTDPLDRSIYNMKKDMGYGDPMFYSYGSRPRARANSTARSDFYNGYLKRLVDRLNSNQQEIYAELDNNKGKIKSILDELIDKGGNKKEIEDLYKKFNEEKDYHKRLPLLVDISKLPNLYSLIFPNKKGQHNPLQNGK
jgi:hypothetical protein